MQLSLKGVGVRKYQKNVYGNETPSSVGRATA
jgi:hypothetical protein